MLVHDADKEQKLKPKEIGIKKNLYNNWISLIPYIIFIALFVLIGILNPSTFSMRWIANKSDAALTLILVAVGQTFVLLTGGFDLSVGGVICITNCISALYLGETAVSMIICCMLCLFIGLVIGFINGIAVVKTGIQPFIVTLATQSICYGTALLILKIDGGKVPSVYMDFFLHRFGVLPVSFIIIALIILGWFYIKHSSYGQAIYAVGSSENAARLVGIKVSRVKVSVYIISGILAAFAGLFRTAQASSGSPTAGADFVMVSISAAVIGGTALSGGSGGIIGSIVGALILRSITDLLVFLKVSSYWTSLVQGVLLIIAVAWSAYGSLRKQRGQIA